MNRYAWSWDPLYCKNKQMEKKCFIDLQDNIQSSNADITEIPEGKERNQGRTDTRNRNWWLMPRTLA